MPNVQWGRLGLAGFVATVAISILQAMAPAMGMPPMNTAAMVGSVFGGQVALGWVVHLMMGVVFWPALYAYGAQPRLPGAPWAQGVLYGLAVGLFVLILGFPAVGAMFAAMTPKPGFLALGMGGPMATMGVLVGHVIYGAVLGALYGRSAA